jgi:hypothetical protein
LPLAVSDHLKPKLERPRPTSAAMMIEPSEVDPAFGTSGLIGRWLAPSC